MNEQLIIEIFNKVEKTLIKLGVLKANSRKENSTLEDDLIKKFNSSTDNDFFFKMAMIVFFSGFKATIVEKKEPRIKKYFSNYKEVSNYKEKEIEIMLNDKEMIKNKNKIFSMIGNSKEFIKINNEYNSFRDYILSFSNNLQSLKSNLMYRFKYLGPATVNHFLTDYGFPVLKPDRMIMRVLFRSHLLDNESEYEYDNAIKIGEIISNKLKIPIRYVDTVLVSLGQEGEANICTKENPKCNKCKLEDICSYYKKWFQKINPWFLFKILLYCKTYK